MPMFVREMQLAHAEESAKFLTHAVIDAVQAHGRDSSQARSLYLAERKAHLRWATLALSGQRIPDLRIARLIRELEGEIARLEAK